MSRLAKKLEGSLQHLIGVRKQTQEERNRRRKEALSKPKLLDNLEDTGILSEDVVRVVVEEEDVKVVMDWRQRSW